jgi:hypothetical protein
VTFEELNRFDRPEVLEIVGRTGVIGDAKLERYKPILHLVLQDGRVLNWSDESGEGSYDLTWDIACDMTREFCSEAKIDKAYADALIEKAAEIDAATDITPFLDAAVDVAKAVRGAA